MRIPSISYNQNDTRQITRLCARLNTHLLETQFGDTFFVVVVVVFYCWIKYNLSHAIEPKATETKATIMNCLGQCVRFDCKPWFAVLNDLNVSIISVLRTFH